MLPHRYAIEIIEGGGVVKPRGILFIRLVEARNVPKTDLFSKTDCYARCCLHASECQTLTACLVWCMCLTWRFGSGCSNRAGEEYGPLVAE